jgi:RimJ/RimL family protein N-acetyltransferase
VKRECFLDHSIPAGTLYLHPSRVADAHRLARYHVQNAQHLGEWDFGWSAARTEPDWHVEHLAAAYAGTAVKGGRLRWSGWLGLRPTPVGEVVGLIELEWPASALVETPTMSLGYSLDLDWQGQGAMAQALRALWPALLAQFGPAMRIQAHVRSDHLRSRALLTRLGFIDLGPDPDFPVIAVGGNWVRHHLFQRTISSTRSMTSWLA